MSRPTLECIVHAASSVTDEPVWRLVVLKRGKQHLRNARAAIAIVALKQRYTFLKIAELFQRDHSTIINWVEGKHKHQPVLDLVTAIEKALASGESQSAGHKVPELPATFEFVIKGTRTVCAVPPGAEKLLERGMSLKRLKQLYPDWSMP